MTQPPPPPPPPPNPYGAPQPQFGPIAPDHPQAQTVLILGIVGLVACGLAAPFAWQMGNRVVREIDASNGAWGGRSSANAGRICGIVGTCILGGSLLLLVLFFFFAIVVGVSSN